MREIKFRVWDGKAMWAVGGLDLDHYDYLLARPVDDDYSWHHITDKINPGSVLMQFTGLHDTNGTEIYEGDVLTYLHGPARARGVVQWIDGGFWIQDPEQGTNHFPAKDNRRVVGNIYQNQDLLEAPLEP